MTNQQRKEPSPPRCAAASRLAQISERCRIQGRQVASEREPGRLFT